MQATEVTPHEFIERARVDAARMMLEGSDRPLKALTFDYGFGSADRMRIVFSTRLGVTPCSIARASGATKWNKAAGNDVRLSRFPASCPLSAALPRSNYSHAPEGACRDRSRSGQVSI